MCVCVSVCVCACLCVSACLCISITESTSKIMMIIPLTTDEILLMLIDLYC